jgi:hypothetical protein
MGVKPGKISLLSLFSQEIPMNLSRKTSRTALALGILVAGLIPLFSSCASQNIAVRRLAPQSRLAGAYIDALGLQRPCAWTGTSFTDLSASLPKGNQGGVITFISLESGKPVYSGSYLAASGELRLFSISGNGFADLGPDRINRDIAPGKYAPVAAGSAGSGVVGCYIDEKKLEKPCYWQNGQRVNLALEPGLENKGAIARAMSSSRGAVIVAGFYYDGEYSQKPCYWDNGAFTDLSASLPEGSLGGVANAVLCL